MGTYSPALGRSCEVCGWPLADEHPNKTCQKCAMFAFLPDEKYRAILEYFQEYRAKNIARAEDSTYVQHLKWMHGLETIHKD